MEARVDHKCGHCGISFSSWGGLVVHLRTFHYNERPYRCCHCTVDFGDIDSLIVHIRNHSADGLGAAVRLVNRMQKLNKLSSDYVASAGEVNMGSTAYKSAMGQPYSCDSGATNKCNRCGLWPSNAVPIWNDSDEIRCQCHVDSLFSNDVPIIFEDKQTKAEVPPEYRPFKCPHCQSGYTQKSNLKVHMRLHTGERPYVCTLCSAAYAQKSNLKSHMRVHTGERPYKCTYCDSAFAQKCNLTTHVRKHTGEKPFKCSKCDAVFAQQCNLKMHYGIHSDERPYRCKHCNATFLQKSNLIAHQRTHSGERPYKCGECSATFLTKSQLTKHSKSHPLLANAE